MLEFIDENDFLLVDTYKENEDGSVSWVYDEGEGLPTHSGVIREGFKRITPEQQGTEDVVVGQDEEGNDITEEQPKMVDVEIDVWAKLLEKETSGEIFIQRLTAEDKDELAQQQQISQFKSQRQQQLDNAVVTTSNGNKYDADEQSISRMANAILAAQRKDLTNIQWSLADTPTGVMTDVTLADLEEAHELAVENMASIWSI
tara:strand:- start:193 stop:798 length:606 start_codon:yes stop_codon:yes gene_type:complete